MKVIDLLNKIANNEEVPKKIKYNDYIYTAKGNAKEHFVDYCSEEDEWCFNHYVRYENLNDEVEIIEDPPKEEILINVCGTLFTKSEYDELAETKEDKKIEKLEYMHKENCENVPIRIEDILDKINEIINKVNGDK